MEFFSLPWRASPKFPASIWIDGATTGDLLPSRQRNVTVSVYGNVLSAVALLHGISTEELTPAELDIKDDNYQVTIAVVARKV
jgi:hypothetical protein